MFSGTQKFGQCLFKAAAICLLLFITSSAVAAGHSYQNTTVGSIPDGQGGCASTLVRNINVTDSFMIGDVNVGLVVEHGYKSDLLISLTSPLGTKVNIIVQVGGASKDFNVLLDDQASTDLTSTDHNASASYYQFTRRASSGLSAFNGEAANGIWSLSLCDQAAPDSGTFSRVQLDFTELVRVASYTDHTLNGTVSALPWDGSKGGVVVNDSAHLSRRGHNANGGGGGNITDAGCGGAVVLNGALCNAVNYSVEGGLAVTSTQGKVHNGPTWGAINGEPGGCLGNFTAVPPILPKYDYSDTLSDGSKIALGEITKYGVATHEIKASLTLGSSVTSETAAAAGSDNVGSGDGSDDGINMPMLVQGESTTIVANVTGTGGYLQAWVDWNGDGDFLDTIEGISEQISVNAQDNTVGVPGRTDDTDNVANQVSIAITIPVSVTQSPTYARFRWSSISDLDSTTPASDGEVEDYLITISQSSACPLGTGVTDSAITPYISMEVRGTTAASRGAVDALDDSWRIAAGRLSTGKVVPWFGRTTVNPLGNNEPSLFTSNGVNVDVAFVNVEPANTCEGTLNSQGNPVLSQSLSLQGSAPRPSSLYDSSSQPAFWNEIPPSGRNNSRNAVRFTFDTPVASFGAWFGDLETRTDGNASPAYLRLLDSSGKRIGNDIAIEPTTMNNSGAVSAVDQSQCGSSGSNVGCGNGSTRWIGFVDSLGGRVKQVLVIIGDDDFGDDAGLEHLSFIGADIVPLGYEVSGTVFEDVNYAGGVGRDQVTAAGIGLNSVSVELYDSQGHFISRTSTANNGTNDGAYRFTGQSDGDYYLRVVSNTVASSRAGSDGSELGVQTFRSDGKVPMTEEVGGHKPDVADAMAYDTTNPSVLNTTTLMFSGGALDGQQAQSVQAVTLAGADLQGTAFGFNFDTITNTNDAGQGSLRQFILNSNTLTDMPNQGINVGYETSIFMIPDGSAYAGTANHDALDLTTAGVARIQLSSAQLPQVSDANTAIDASTQNAASCGASRTLKVVVSGVGLSTDMDDGLSTDAANTLVRGLSIGGFSRYGVYASENADGLELYCNHIGLDAAGSVALPNRANGVHIDGAADVAVGDGTLAGKNIIAANQGAGVAVVDGANNITFLRNLIGVAFDGSTLVGNADVGIRVTDSTAVQVGNGSESGRNQISGNASDGVLVTGSSEVYIRRNILYANDGLGIDLYLAGSEVTLNNVNDEDTGPNGLLNFPQFTASYVSNGQLTVAGCAPAGATIELFESDVSPTSSSGASVGDNQFGMAQNYGEGERWLATWVEGIAEDTVGLGISCNSLSDSDGNSAEGLSPFQWTVPVPAGIVLGDQVTATATLSGTGTSEFSALSVVSSFDYGDAPDSYYTTQANAGASHSISNDVYLGALKPDADVDGQASTAADGDGSDEDGVSTLPTLTVSDRSYAVSVTATNASGESATLMAWIDFDGNGQFDNDEAAMRQVPAGSINKNIRLRWSDIPVGIQAGNSYLRLRLTTDSLSNREPSGNKQDGEVEDYLIPITTRGVTVSGRVFKDTNANMVNDSHETGVTQLPIVLYNIVSGKCVSARTNGEGYYQFNNVLAGDYQLYEASRERVPVPRDCAPVFAKDPSGYRSTTYNVRPAFTVGNSDIVGQDFADVKPPTFAPSHRSQVLPGNVVFYAHRFSTPTQGAMSIRSVSGGQQSQGWSSLIYQDDNCNGRLDGAEAKAAMSGSMLSESTWLSRSFNLTAGGHLCLINKVYAPANVAANDRYQQHISVHFDYQNAVAGTQVLKVQDVSLAQQVQSPTLPETPVIDIAPAIAIQPEQLAIGNTPATDKAP